MQGDLKQFISEGTRTFHWPPFAVMFTQIARFSLATYIVEVHERYQRNPEILTEFAGLSLKAILKSYFIDRQTKYQHHEEHKAILNAKLHQNFGEYDCGLIETGEYGYTSDFYDLTKKKITFKRTTKQAEMLPFFFLFYIPPGQRKGVVVFQRFGHFGIRNSFMRDFSEYMKERAPGYTISIEPVVHPQLMNQLIKQGTVTSICFRQLRLPSDLCEKFSISASDASHIYADYNIKSTKSSSLSFARKLLAKIPLYKSGSPSIIADPPNFKSDRVLFDVILGQTKRRIDIADLSKTRSYYDITDDVEVGSDGHPIFESVLDISKEVANDIWLMLEGA